MAATVYYRQGLNGAGSTDLDEVADATLNDGDPAFVFDGTNFYCYRLDATSGAAHSSPDVIQPADSASSKRWILQDVQNAENNTNTGIITAHTVNATHTFDTDSNWCRVIVTGSGGTGITSTGAGQAAGTAIKILSIPAATATIVVGASKTTGNTAGASSSYADGTNTVSATGGGINSGAAGIGSGGDINLKGGYSGVFTGSGSTEVISGGASYWGGGSDEAAVIGAYGSGGGSKYNGTNGYSGSGVVYIEEFK